tara:strand:+ start:3170 stop:3364 length:195 start_codon:yes stop_codon:yes gene_type:complete
MKSIAKLLILIGVAVLMQGCATTSAQNEEGLSDQTYATTPSIENNSYLYRSPPVGAIRAHGLGR